MHKQKDTTIRPWCTQSFAHIKRNKTPLTRDIYETNSIWWYNHLGHTIMEKYDNNVRGWYFQFDDDNKRSYKYIFSIT